MKKIYIARVADDNSDAVKPTFDLSQAFSYAEDFKAHLTDRERKTHTVTVEAYDVDISDDDKRSAQEVYNSLTETDEFPYDPVEYSEI